MDLAPAAPELLTAAQYVAEKAVDMAGESEIRDAALAAVCERQLHLVRSEMHGLAALVREHNGKRPLEGAWICVPVLACLPCRMYRNCLGRSLMTC